MIAQFWVTTQCNMKCKYCYKNITNENIYMTKKVADKSIEYLVNHFNEICPNEIVISFNGGEALLNFEIVKYIFDEITNKFKDKSIKPKFLITTNLLKMDKNILDFLTNNIDSIFVSIDGNENYNDLNRVLQNGSGTYTLVNENIKELLKKRNDIVARITVHKNTYDGLFLNIKHLYDIGFSSVLPTINYYDKRWDNEIIQKLHLDLCNIAKILIEYENKNPSSQLGFAKKFNCKTKNTCCDGGVSSINIDSLGMIYPCTHSVGYKEFIIGSVFEGINKDKLKYISDLDKVKNDDCIDCEKYNYCVATRCKIVNKIYNGNYHKPSSLICEEQRLLSNIYNFIES